MRVTAYLDAALVGTATAYAPNPGTWPTGQLSIQTISAFNRVVIHYDAPPTGENWGPIFMADNIEVQAVPEPAGLLALAAGLLLLSSKRR